MSPEICCLRGSQTTTNRKSLGFFKLNQSNDYQNLRKAVILEDSNYHCGLGSENAPDESGFLSGEAPEDEDYYENK